MMQFSLFDEEPEQPEPQGDTYYCQVCKKDLPERAFASFAIAMFNREKGVASANAGGKAKCCRACRQKYDQSIRIARKTAPPKPTIPTPCDCCGAVIQPQNLQLDHDHVTHVFRGWLCKACNSGLGKMGDNIEGLEKGIAYLRRVNE